MSSRYASSMFESLEGRQFLSVSAPVGSLATPAKHAVIQPFKHHHSVDISAFVFSGNVQVSGVDRDLTITVTHQRKGNLAVHIVSNSMGVDSQGAGTIDSAGNFSLNVTGSKLVGHLTGSVGKRSRFINGNFVGTYNGSHFGGSFQLFKVG